MDSIEKLQAIGKGFEDMFRNGCGIKVTIPVGYLHHEPTGTQI